MGQMISLAKPLRIKSFLPFNFAITKTYVGMHLAKDGTGMGSIILTIP